MSEPNCTTARDPNALPVPGGLRSAKLQLGSEQYLVLSHPLQRWTLPSGLTPAECEIVTAILNGASRSQVASARGSSISTVSNLLAQVFRKLGVRSRIELAAQLSVEAGGSVCEHNDACESREAFKLCSRADPHASTQE
jgi:DNA-binding CsgD family transcriptional regulator